MKETPIIMSGNHPKLVLDGIKTQTRRVIKPQPDKQLPNDLEHPGWNWGDGSRRVDLLGTNEKGIRMYLPYVCPYGQVGDRLWVRETHYQYGHWIKNGVKGGKQRWKFKEGTRIANTGGYALYLDDPPLAICKDKGDSGWFKRPSLFMPKK